jgi:hypothetical protein
MSAGAAEVLALSLIGIAKLKSAPRGQTLARPDLNPTRSMYAKNGPEYR